MQVLEERAVLADLDFICSNLTRISILYLLMRSKHTNYCMSLKEISYRLGKHPRIVIYHLEKLKEYGLVEVVKNSRNGKRRRIWGLNLNRTDLIREVFLYATRNFFTQARIERACSVNRKVR